MITHDAMSHEECVELLPWLVNESLQDHEREAVQAHATSCIICRRELAELKILRQSIQTTTTEAPAPDMRRINARIDAQLAREAEPRKLLERLRGLFATPLRAAFAAQSLALVAVAALWLQAETGEPQFRTLTTSTALPAGHYLRVVFDPTLEQAAIDALLAAAGLSIAAGPSERGVMTLRFADTVDAADRSAAADVLRDDSRVLFVQPVAGGE